MSKCLFLAGFLLTLFTVGACPQIATTTSLVGTVADSSGKGIPNARVKVTETGTGDTHTTSTNAQGYYAPTSDCGRGHLVGCIDATAFTVADLYPLTPTNYAYGNAGRNLLFGPGSETVNFSMFKNFPIKERLKFQLRFETFALFNHTNFGNPSAAFGTGSFGNITSASGSRTIQFGTKLQF